MESGGTPYRMCDYDNVSKIEEPEKAFKPDRLPDTSALPRGQRGAVTVTRAIDSNQPVRAVLKRKQDLLGETAATVQDNHGAPHSIATFQEVDLIGVELKDFTDTGTILLRFHSPETQSA